MRSREKLEQSAGSVPHQQLSLWEEWEREPRGLGLAAHHGLGRLMVGEVGSDRSHSAGTGELAPGSHGQWSQLLKDPWTVTPSLEDPWTVIPIPEGSMDSNPNSSRIHGL